MAQVQIPLAARRALNPVLGMAGVKGLTRYTLTLQPAAEGIDTYVRAGIPNNNYGDSTQFRASSGGYTGLIKFTGLSAVPVGASLVSVTFNLWAYQAATGNATAKISRILAANSAWTEMGATWNYALASTVRWAGDTGGDGGADAGCTVSGTDYSSTQLGSFAFSTTDVLGTAYSASLNLTEFNLLLAGNYGMVIGGIGSGLAYFCSSDHATAGYRPQIIVVYDA